MSYNGFDPTGLTPFDEEFLRQRQHQQRQENLILRFYQEGVPNPQKSAEAGREICDTRDMVSIIVPGSKDDFVTEVTEVEKKRFGPQYERWKATQEQPTSGQPLEHVPWLNVAQVRELQYLNVKTLEQLAGLSDAAIQHIGMGAMDLRKKARAYIETAKDGAEVARLLNRISELERESARYQDSITQVNARYEALLKTTEQTEQTEQTAVTAAPAPPSPAPPAVDIAALIRAEVAEMMKTLKTGE